MKRFLRSVTCFVLMLFIVLEAGALTTVRAADGDEIRAAKKIISVVCDDSGSMGGESNRWTYANYAMQTLIAQLNQQDELYVTFMSQSSTYVHINGSDLLGEVRTMEGLNCGGSTPYQAVKTAYERLVSIKGQDKNTQYWLIVTTDGSIDDIPNYDGMNGTIQSVLDKHKGEKMDNGTRLNVAYLAMDATLGCASDVANNLHTYTATTPAEISTSLSEISNLISGRLKADPVTQIDGKTISFESKLPVYSISVLSQQSAAEVVSVSTGEGSLNIDRNIPLRKEFLFGNAAVVTALKVQGKNQVIPAGTYTITFSEDVNLNDLLVQYEPAIGVKMNITVDGIEVSDFSALKVGDNMAVELVPVIPGTDTPIDPATLPSGIRWSLGYLVDGQEKTGSSSTKLAGISLLPGSNVIRGTMQIPGFSELIFEKRFDISAIIYGLTVNQPDEDKTTYPRRKPEDSIKDDNAITFTVTNDGVPMTKEELLANKVSLKTDSIEVNNDDVPWYLRGWSNCGIKYRLNDDGTFTLIPNVLVAFLARSGKYTVTAYINNAPNETAVATFTLKASPMDWIDLLPLLLLLLLGIYIIMLICKKKFDNQSLEIITYTELGNGLGYRGGAINETLNRFCGSFWLPTWKKCTKTISGVTFVADGGSDVYISGRSIEKNENIMAFGTSNYDPMTEINYLKDSLTQVMNGTERSAPDISMNRDTVLYIELTSGRVISFKIFD